MYRCLSSIDRAQVHAPNDLNMIPWWKLLFYHHIIQITYLSEWLKRLLHCSVISDIVQHHYQTSWKKITHSYISEFIALIIDPLIHVIYILKLWNIAPLPWTIIFWHFESSKFCINTYNTWRLSVHCSTTDFLQDQWGTIWKTHFIFGSI